MNARLKSQKSVGVSVVLTFFFSFFGLLYSSVISFLVVGVLSVLLFLTLFGSIGDAHTVTTANVTTDAEYAGAVIGAGIAGIFFWFIWWILTWIPSCIIGLITTQRHNRKVVEQRNLMDEARHQETLAALHRERG